MEIQKSLAVEMLVSLGFMKAASWDDEKILKHVKMVPSKISLTRAEEVGVLDLYRRLKKAGEKVTLAAAADPKKVAKVLGVSAVERDRFGCVEDSISAKVNSKMSEEWQEEEGIAKECRVTLDQARGRLYSAVASGVFERRHQIQYRIKPA